MRESFWEKLLSSLFPLFMGMGFLAIFISIMIESIGHFSSKKYTQEYLDQKCQESYNKGFSEGKLEGNTEYIFTESKYSGSYDVVYDEGYENGWDDCYEEYAYIIESED